MKGVRNLTPATFNEVASPPVRNSVADAHSLRQPNSLDYTVRIFRYNILLYLASYQICNENEMLSAATC